MVSCPEDNIDINRLATCSKPEPTTCFDASNAQIFRGRWGLSHNRLKTRTKSAKIPSAPWMKRAKGPSNLHSPFSAPDLDSPPDVRFNGEVGFAVDKDVECLGVDAAMCARVGEKTISIISEGKEWPAGVGMTTSSGDMMLKGQETPAYGHVEIIDTKKGGE